MHAETRTSGRSHVIVFVLIIAAMAVWLLFARPKLLGQNEPQTTSEWVQPDSSAKNLAE